MQHTIKQGRLELRSTTPRCGECHGAGYRMGAICPRCDGTGKAPEKKRLRGEAAEALCNAIYNLQAVAIVNPTFRIMDGLIELPKAIVRVYFLTPSLLIIILLSIKVRIVNDDLGFGLVVSVMTLWTVIGSVAAQKGKAKESNAAE